jgi:hypothetical protein
MFRIASIFSGFASMPDLDTIQLNNIPLDTPKIHFSRFYMRPYFLKFVKVSLRSSMC